MIAYLFCNKIFICTFCVNGISFFVPTMCIYFILSTNAAVFKQILVSETLHISTGRVCLSARIFASYNSRASFKKNERLQIYHFQIHLLPYPELNSKLILLSILPMKTLKVPFSVKKKSEENYIFFMINQRFIIKKK
jgi:hypothetical protein